MEIRIKDYAPSFELVGKVRRGFCSLTHRTTDALLRTFQCEEFVSDACFKMDRIIQAPMNLLKHAAWKTEVLGIRILFGIGLGKPIFQKMTADDYLADRFMKVYVAKEKTHLQLKNLYRGMPESVRNELPKPPYFGHAVDFTEYQYLGSQVSETGTHFAVKAPRAKMVGLVLFDAEGRERGLLPMHKDEKGIWSTESDKVGPGQRYMYRIHGEDNSIVDKLDPYGKEVAPRRNLQEAPQSVVHASDAFEWSDDSWLSKRAAMAQAPKAQSIYEAHVAAWTREDGHPLGFRELGDRLSEYCEKMGYTHVELLGVLDHPFEGSWGYQVTTLMAPNQRLGTAEDFKYLVNKLHESGVGVIIDWIPAHFATDDFGLKRFDGSEQYEQSWWTNFLSPAFHYCRWGTRWFDFGSKSTRDFLISSAHYWLDEMHVDGLRVDAMASILNRRNTADSKVFLRDLNYTVHERFPGVQTIAEDFTGDWRMTRPLNAHGFGFDHKWHTGWMHFTLKYFEEKLRHRPSAHSAIKSATQCDNGQKMVLALSHDEVANTKKTLINKTPGIDDVATRLANMRLLLSYQWCLPGKKLVFMGEDLGATQEWSHRFIKDQGLDWDELLKAEGRPELAKLVQDLNHFYRSTPAFYEKDDRPTDMEWFCSKRNESVIGYRRQSLANDSFVCLHNFSEKERQLRLDLKHPDAKKLKEVLNSDAEVYGGKSKTPIDILPILGDDGITIAYDVTLPPLSTVVFEVIKN